MSIQSNFPATKPSLLLDFANSKKLDPRVTFTRSTTGTYYDGVTYAKAEENLLTYSDQFDNAVWVKQTATVTAEAIAAPDGTNTADTLSVTSTNGRVSQTFTYIVGYTYTFSVWVKRKTGTGNVRITANANETVGLPITITTDWQRFTQTVTSTVTSGGVAIRCDTSGDEIYVWGAQLEQRSSVTAYTATTSSPISNDIPVLQTAAVNQPRFDHNPVTEESLGLLIEESRTNLCLNSNISTGWTATRSSITQNSTVAPDGTLSAIKIVEDLTASNSHYIAQSITVANATVYTLSVYAKAAGRNYITLYVNTSTAENSYFDLVNGVVSLKGGSTTDAKITPVGDGWYRCSVTWTTANTTELAAIGPSSTSTNNVNTGDGYSGVFVWGAQLEQGAFATSYIPTTSATVTRGNESALMNGTNFSSWYNQAQGSLYTEMSIDGWYTYPAMPTFANFASGVNPNFISLYSNSLGNLVAMVRVGATNYSFPSIAITATGNHKYSFSYSSTSVGLSADNTTAATSTNTLLPICDTFFIAGGSVTYTQNGNAMSHIKKIAYYPIQVTNAQLQALTS